MTEPATVSFVELGTLPYFIWHFGVALSDK